MTEYFETLRFLHTILQVLLIGCFGVVQYIKLLRAVLIILRTKYMCIKKV